MGDRSWTGISFSGVITEEQAGEAALSSSNLKEFREKGATLDDVLRYLDQVDNFRKHYPPLVVQ